MGKILKSKAVEVIEDPNPEPEVDDEPEPGPKIIAELVSLQGDFLMAHRSCRAAYSDPIFQQRIPSLAAMRASFSLKSPDEYDPLQICLQEMFTGDQTTYGAKYSRFNFYHR